MNNTGAKPLNTNDGWEEIVNENAKRRVSARERVAARRIERKKRTLKASTCLLSVAALVFVVLGIAGVMAGWIAATVSIICMFVACLQFGRYLGAEGK